ncbi:hypothetical protein ACETU7_08900 [Rhodococcus sp. 3Y1]
MARNGSVEWMCVPRPDSPACSVPSSTAAQAISVSAPTARTCRPLGAICRVDSFSRPPGRPRPAGSSSATPWFSVPGTTSTSDRTRTSAHRPTGMPNTPFSVRSNASAAPSNSR